VCPDRDKGDRLTLKEIQKLVDDDAALQNLSEDQKQEFIAELQIHRDTKKTGVRASNQAAATDCRGTIDRVSREVRQGTCKPSGQTALNFLFLDEKLVRTNRCMRSGFLHTQQHSRYCSSYLA
jgi:hypothetical protein